VRTTRALDGIALVPADGRLVATFSNQLPVPLENLSLRLHHEGCYGKPGAPTEEKAFRPPGGAVPGRRHRVPGPNPPV